MRHLLSDEVGYVFGDMDAQDVYATLELKRRGPLERIALDGGRTQVVMRAESDQDLLADQIVLYLRRLKQKDDIVVCGICGSMSCYAYVNYAEECVPPIYMVGACSGDEWTCGKCSTRWVRRDSMLLAEVFTHEKPPDSDW